ncbi:EVI5-like protein isoform X2 [Octopus sinensis]|nr:EVI5-like protein isoform X2 [Octopus sinensis]
MASDSKDCSSPLTKPTVPNPVKPEDLELLAKLEEANRKLEADEKSLKALPNYTGTPPTHSRKGSGSSLLSNSSLNSYSSNHIVEEEIASENLWQTWGRIVNEWDNLKKKPTNLKELVRKGIPHPFRGLAWQLLLNVHDSPAKERYVDYLKKTSPSEKLIRRDIARTFPDHDFFKEKDGLGQESLFNVMKAYSLHDREVGYCQGSGFIVGLLLMQMPEEEAFAVLVTLMQEYRLRELFKPSMAELGLCMYQLECMIQELLPNLHIHFQTQGFHTSMYASSWFLTLFATSLPLSLACRVMDLFISEGMEIVFRIGMAILQMSQEILMSLDMEGMLKFFQKTVPAIYEQDQEKLIHTAFLIKYNAKKMKRLEKDYTALKSKENEEQIELRRLRTENRLLRQRIENLEKESASLADKLIQDQVTRAQEAEETFILKNQLASGKQQLHETQRKLQEADKLISEIKERTDSINVATVLDDKIAQHLVQQLQEELISVRLKDNETAAVIKDMKVKIKELEDTNQMLQRAPSNDVQHLQEELIAVKLREAEANLSLKELRMKVNELDQFWEKHCKNNFSPNVSEVKNCKHEVRILQEELMTVRIREAQSLSALKEMKQKVMELETQNQICTNQIKRMDGENKLLKEKILEEEDKEKMLQLSIKDLKREGDNLASERKEDLMMFRIKEAEAAQMVGELKQKIAHLEVQKAELITSRQLMVKGGTQDLENKIYDLQDEVLQLKMDHGKGLETATMVGSFMSVGGDDEEMRELMDSETLNRTLTEIIEGKSDTSAHLNGFLDLSPNNTDSESQNNETTGEDDSLAVLEKTVQSFERSLEDKSAV